MQLERRRQSGCPINEMQALKLLQNDEDMQRGLNEILSLMQLLQQRNDIQGKVFCDRLSHIESKQNDIMETINTYKKYTFAGVFALSVAAAVGALFVGIFDRAEAIKRFFGG